MKKKVYIITLILISIIVIAKIAIEAATYYYENTSREKVLTCSNQERQETSTEKHITKVPIHQKKSCLEIGGKWGKKDCERDEEEKCFLTNKKSCLAAGGDWGCFGGLSCASIFTANMSCTFPYIDGGKECTDGSECIGGWCMNELVTKGGCIKNPRYIFSGFEYWENGEVKGTLYVD